MGQGNGMVRPQIVRPVQEVRTRAGVKFKIGGDHQVRVK